MVETLLECSSITKSFGGVRLHRQVVTGKAEAIEHYEPVEL
jgi:hypothetical protein